jgi:gliding motility-associated lipoprotein GldH
MATIKNRIVYFVVALCFTLLLSCNRGEIFFRFHHISHSQWQMDDAVVFTMDSLDFRQDRKYQVLIELTANATYPYRDLWLFVEHNLTDSVFRRDSLQFFLVSEYGRRLGSGVGGLRQLSIPLLTGIALDTAQVYELRIGHGMRSNPLRGIEKMGVKVVEMR